MLIRDKTASGVNCHASWCENALETIKIELNPSTHRIYHIELNHKMERKRGFNLTEIFSLKNTIWQDLTYRIKFASKQPFNLFSSHILDI